MDKDQAIQTLSLKNREIIGNNSFKVLQLSEASDIAALIEQQAEQIMKMRDCSNCIANMVPCYGNEKGEPCDEWEWDGGSGE